MYIVGKDRKAKIKNLMYYCDHHFYKIKDNIDIRKILRKVSFSNLKRLNPPLLSDTSRNKE